MSRPQRALVDLLLPILDSGEVELQEDAFTAVLSGRYPGGSAVAGELDQAGGDVADAVHLVKAGESEKGVDLLHLVDRHDSADAGVELGPRGISVTISPLSLACCGNSAGFWR